MMMRLLSLLVVIGVTTCFGAYEDYGENDLHYSLLGTDEVKNCTEQGELCEDCYHLVLCVEDQENTFTKIPLLTCDKSKEETCFNNAECSTNFNPQCNDYTFKCTGTGVFPDPFDCKKYHYCVLKPGSTMFQADFQCPPDRAYNMVSTYCDLMVKDCPVNRPPCPQCKKAGQTGTLVNKSIWYLCKIVGNYLVPELHLCPNGKWYNGKACVAPLPPTSPTTSKTPTTPKPSNIYIY